MRALKVLVIVMAVAILAGFALVVFTIAMRLDDGPDGERGFGRVAAGVPEGCVVAEMVPENGRLLLRLEGPETRGCQIILVLDLETGARLGELDLTQAPSRPDPAQGGAD